MSKKVNIITLGCSKNLVDSEVLATHLKKNKFRIKFDDKVENNDIAIINTCGFINDSKEESIETIFDYIQAKNAGMIEKVYVMGCLTERYRDEITADIPEIDGVFGVNELPQILNAMSTDYVQKVSRQRVISTPAHYAYLKIAEGCNKSCSFCAIPKIRGRHISKSIEEIAEETENLTKNGAKEIMLISQDLSFYGKDYYKEYKLKNLLEKLITIDKLQWLRLHYLYPTNFLAPVLDLMKESEKICKYIDIPLQHINSEILKSMNRGHNEKTIRDLIQLFRAKNPDIALRTTMIVGYPNETEEQFYQLYKFVEDTKFDRLGVFPYSEEENTKASHLQDNIPDDVKQERVQEIMELQSNISRDKNSEKIGKKLKVIIDSEENDYYVGRTEYDSPEVDNEVLIDKTKRLEIGEFYDVEIYSAEDFDLFGRV